MIKVLEELVTGEIMQVSAQGMPGVGRGSWQKPRPVVRIRGTGGEPGAKTSGDGRDLAGV